MILLIPPIPPLGSPPEVVFGDEVVESLSLTATGFDVLGFELSDFLTAARLGGILVLCFFVF